MATDKDYEIAVNRGTKLLQLLLADDSGAGHSLDPLHPFVQSSFTSAQDLPTHGYIQHQADPAKTRREFQSLIPALQALGLNSTMACDGGHNIRVNHTHATNSLLDDYEYDAANAGFAQICNPVDGVLIAYANYNKSNGVHAKLYTPLHHWSDVAYLQHLTASASLVSPSMIEYIFRLRILHSATRSILDRIVNMHNDGNYSIWPGITFDIASDEGKAILGTVHGAGVAWMLIQRKKEFGGRRIGSVTVFWAENDDAWPNPSLLFRIM